MDRRGLSHKVMCEQRSEGNTSRQGIWERNGLGRGRPELGSVLAISKASFFFFFLLDLYFIFFRISAFTVYWFGDSPTILLCYLKVNYLLIVMGEN